MDVVSDIVGSLELRSSLYFRLAFSGPFSVSVPGDRRRIRFHVAGSGRSWVGLPSGEGAWVGDGDLVLVPHGSPHVLASRPTLEAVRLGEVLAARPADRDGVLRLGSGGDRGLLVCGHFEFDETLVHPLIESLPPLLHLPARDGGGYAWVPPLLEATERESRSDEPAGGAVARRLAEILFIQVFRSYLASDAADRGVLALLDDPQLGRALRAIHAEPGRDWSLGGLAATAGISRTLFAERFRARVGTTPMRYLARWRVQKARALLSDPALSVGEVGRRVGYASEAAFSRVFKQALGEAPGRYRRSFGRSSKECGRARNPSRASLASGC